MRPAECGGKLTCAVTCGNPGSFVQATQHIYLKLDGRGLLLVGALGCCRHLGWIVLWVGARL